MTRMLYNCDFLLQMFSAVLDMKVSFIYLKDVFRSINEITKGFYDSSPQQVITLGYYQSYEAGKDNK